MKFSELLIDAIRQSEIPLRFEPGAEESVAGPVTAFLAAWLEGHAPESDSQRALIARLLAELADLADLPE